MKKIIPFEKELLFKTSVNEITAISLEHNLDLNNEDTISGNFIITGEYKITGASIQKESFSFELPFDIALGTRLNTKECVIDIDDFNYKLKDSNTLYVKIDLYIEGEEETILESDSETSINDDKVVEEQELRTINIVKDLPEIASEVNIMSNKSNIVPEDTMVNNNTNININNEEDTNNLSSIFNDVSDNETYATYRVYIVKEEDTIDKIIEKYDIDKDKLELYNNLSEIKTGDKLIIPSM